MDTLATSVSILNVPSLPSTSREFYHLKTPNTSPLPPHTHLSSATGKPNSNISNKTAPFTPNSFTFPFLSSRSLTSSSKSSSNVFHKRPSTGYAAALVDIAQCKSSLHEVQKDVQRFSKLLKNKQIQAVLEDPFVKGQVVKEVAKKRGFNRHLMGLLKMLVEKGKVGMVEEVLDEFERIYEELCGTRMVLASTA